MAKVKQIERRHRLPEQMGAISEHTSVSEMVSASEQMNKSSTNRSESNDSHQLKESIVSNKSI